MVLVLNLSLRGSQELIIRRFRRADIAGLGPVLRCPVPDLYQGACTFSEGSASNWIGLFGFTLIQLPANAGLSDRPGLGDSPSLRGHPVCPCR